MNKVRRKTLESIQEKLKGFRSETDFLGGVLEEFREDIESVMEDEEMAYDNLPESLQDAERGENMQSAIDAMGNAIDSVDEAISALENAIDEIDGLLNEASDNLQEAIDI